jgi:hypothetical protein
MVTQFRIGFEEGTINKIAAILHGEAQAQSARAAETTGILLVDECKKIIRDENIIGPRKDPPRNRPDPRRRLSELYAYETIHTAEGSRVFITTVPDATKDEISKVKAIEAGARGHYDITPRRARALSFYDREGTHRLRKAVNHPPTAARNIARRARDRVYQRLRRGVV